MTDDRPPETESQPPAPDGDEGPSAEPPTPPADHPSPWRGGGDARAELPVWGPSGPPPESPPDRDRIDEPAPPPPLRGRHLAWARFEPGPDVTVTPSPEPSASPGTAETAAPPGRVETPVTPDERPSPPPRPPEEPVTTPMETRVPAPAPPPRTPAPPSPRGAEGGRPSALGRLIAVVVTCGLGWALAVAVGIWLVVFLVSRGG